MKLVPIEPSVWQLKSNWHQLNQSSATQNQVDTNQTNRVLPKMKLAPTEPAECHP